MRIKTLTQADQPVISLRVETKVWILSYNPQDTAASIKILLNRHRYHTYQLPTHTPPIEAQFNKCVTGQVQEHQILVGPFGLRKSDISQQD